MSLTTLACIVIGILIVIIIIILLNDSARKSMATFITSPPVRNITAQFIESQVKPRLIQHCRKINPLLSVNQVDQLDRTLTKALLAWREGKDIKPMLRGILALAVPYGDYAYDLIEAYFKHSGNYQNNVNNNQHNNPPNSQDIKYHPSNEQLVSKFGADYSKISAIPQIYQNIIVSKLNNVNEPIVCGISLEPILQNGKLSKDVVVIINTHTQHIYFFYKASLEMWFSRRLTNPMTREAIDPQRDLFHLS
ncbi:MAG: hypothetical protein Solumvirus1_6 [Solumvirus sp.]|uniref:Uncharacterized protein n=1 Tax=Solumvirus sp. TaxID=2487773 RepID=A0A3G5AIK1_9VIRU|nr:MAG: hypothetical protein Solumvirus1_6 [Solumvirus sp.]